MLILTASDVSEVFGMREAFESVREAAVAHVEARTAVPPRVALRTAETDGEFLVMPGVVDASVFGTKVWFAFPEAHGSVPATAAMILLVDPGSGQEVLMDGSVITDMRTGAMTGLAAERLAPEGATTLAVIGTGIQARTQALALLHALPAIETIRVTSRSADRRQRFAGGLAAEVAREHRDRAVRVVAVDDGEGAVAGAQVVVAATTSAVPVIEDSWLDGDVLVCSVGSHDPRSAEIAPATVGRASTVVVDTYVGGATGAGDVSGPIASGLLDPGSVIELGDLLLGRRSPSRVGVRIFKSVGFAAADVACARAVLTAARKRRLGRDVALHS
ncbi:ornithine cyclodeaminase family protein [Cryobacterium tepidiphilum]|uniref:Ornithine cyclodeaminase family protein n=1 Tax=Cryobacterium tepidiphilum TaxID=2486026 RepID=A0A3M8KT77_9MICO|nr:ornithine cyclodeaminase family protein [Cryobacterium tepidiphilum]RNE56507.1 ornithine cyclodeaminase family protein [Cryobacterium tepidiphilum]